MSEVRPSRFVTIQISVLLKYILLVVGSVRAGENERYRHAPCKILFNEIQMKGGPSDFIELAKYCPTPGRKTPFLGLDGYYILAASGSKELTVELALNLDGKQLEAMASQAEAGINEVNTRRGRKRPGVHGRTDADAENEHESTHDSDGRTSFTDSVSDDRSLDAAEVPPERLSRSVTAFWYFNQSVDALMLHNASYVPRKKRSNRFGNHRSVNYFVESIPSSRVKIGEITLIMLLHYKQSGRKDKNVEHFRKGQELSSKDISSIKAKLKDVVLLGQIVPTDLKEKIMSINEKVAENPISPSSVKADEQSFSINKCDQSAGTFNVMTSQYCSPTPANINSCKILANEQVEAHPFAFAGKSIKTHGQQLAINVFWALKNNKIGEILNIGPLRAASLLLNLNEKTIQRFQHKYETNAIGTPAKKRKLPKSVRDTIDDAKEQMIYDILASHYKRNVVPKINTVREMFVENVRSSQLSISPAPDKLFHCGLRTFRKILHELGYKFSKINNRDAVLFDPRIVAWRGKYLKAIRDNDNKAPDFKLPVIYTDETWFDIYSRQAYGWVRKCPKTVQEKKDFTFAKHKVARGPRIIIMHAGGENGFVEGMEEVYAVSKKDAAGDYHDNVNSESYLKWFNKLLTTLEGKGPHIIVIDNAPYHSMSTAPPLSSRKQVLYNWLTEQKSTGKDVPDLANLRKFELEDVVRKLKSEEPYYKIDDLAREKGHKVLRTPPYNCQLNPIELVWSDVKRTLREQNTDQNLQLNLLRAKTILQSYDADLWKRHVNHVKRLEQDYWEGDLEFENTMDRNPDMEIAALDENEGELSESETEEQNENADETSETPGPSKKPRKTQ